MHKSNFAYFDQGYNLLGSKINKGEYEQHY